MASQQNNFATKENCPAPEPRGTGQQWQEPVPTSAKKQLVPRGNQAPKLQRCQLGQLFLPTGVEMTPFPVALSTAHLYFLTGPGQTSPPVWPTGSPSLLASWSQVWAAKNTANNIGFGLWGSMLPTLARASSFRESFMAWQLLQ